MNIFETMQYINSFSKSGEAVKDLERFERIMQALGNPQKGLKIIHIAGTNGKGSVARMLANSLSLAGYKTGEFTSPFLTVYSDRIRINGVNIQDNELCEIVTQMRPILDGLTDGCSQFEITTAIAFVYFAALKCHAVVLETGLGGLLDCTNIIEQPLVSVITSVSLDHTAVLGNTLELVAAQKAGIIKSDCPVVLSPNQEKSVWAVVYNAAIHRGSKFVVPDTEKLKVEKSDFTGNKFTYKNALYETAMLGTHQIDNALTAIETLEILKQNGYDRLDFTAVHNGIKSAKLLARCQVLKPEKPFMLIDGAHNPGGMKVLAEFIAKIPKTPKIMICGISEEKDWRTALQYITPYIDVGICVDGFSHKTVFAPTLATLFRNGETKPLKDAVSRAMGLAGDKGMVIIAGSLYLASELNKQMQ